MGPVPHRVTGLWNLAWQQVAAIQNPVQVPSLLTCHLTRVCITVAMLKEANTIMSACA